MTNEIPQHVAIIPDGNRRWAKDKGKMPWFGHYVSAKPEKIMEFFKVAKDIGVGYVSLWGFSTENWKRDDKEVKAIFEMILKNIDNFRKKALEENVRFRHIGRKDRLPKELVAKLESLEEETKEFGGLNVQLCLDYGGRDEIIRAVNKIINEGRKEINEEDFEEHLDTNGIPDVDLIIRTSGEHRISGLMPFQGTYAELYFTETLFPDFGGKEFKEAIEEYGKRKRRFGGS